jgi:hypothetical protein
MEGETPREALTACARWAGLSGWISEEEASPGEDEPALARVGGRQCQEHRAGQPETARIVAGVSDPDGSLLHCTQHSEGQLDLKRAPGDAATRRREPHSTANLRRG